jgi:uncharacterized protein (TIGR00730 family)
MQAPRRVPLAYFDPRFMTSPAARPVRILAEYLDPYTRLQREGIADTIVMFGSARVLPYNRAQRQFERVRERAREAGAAGRRRLERAAMAVRMARYYEEARQLAFRITSWALTLGDRPRRFVICSGGGPGIMEAANRGAHEAGGKTIGLGIELPREQRSNRYISPELDFQFHYFFMRKLWFAQLAKALIVFPGGFGTMDELWEVLTLLQTGKLPRHHLILIYGRDYWDRVLNWREMIRHGTITEQEFRLLRFADTVDEAFEHVRKTLLKYHMKLEPRDEWPV